MFFVINKKTIIRTIILLMSLVTILTCFIVNIPMLQNTFAAKKIVPIYKVDTQEKVVAISFDAAWGADKTEKIMEILKLNDANATFFLVGFWVEQYPELVKKIYDNGFELGNHSDNHLKMSALGEDEIKKEIVSVNNMIYDLTGYTPKVFRAPFGDYNNLLCDTITSLNMLCIQWDVDSLDWKGLSGSEIASRIISKTVNGSIILCHNNSEHILDALPMVLLSLKNKGFKIVSVGELVYHEDYYIDSQGIQHKNPQTQSDE